MINVGTYVKILLKKRNLTQMDLIRKMNEMDLGNGVQLYKQHLNNAINGDMSFLWARRIEIVLNLPKYSLVKMVGNPTELQWKKIMGVGDKYV